VQGKNILSVLKKNEVCASRVFAWPRCDAAVWIFRFRQWWGWQ